ncbi:hypothetical protein BGZ96_002943 [Linnemannia gamsii]|uniref:Crinkler effector protein N-terminal domain-containing protein n=1 Tax=Linnemannia gamsii TaxID=64522 RepID=A0ABQ7JJW2_9FUNG|nr:hypothetical protein BGZ96_002943 [Linnemannia gamsii]
MSDNRPTLMCLVEGDPISKAFAMPIPSTGIIGLFRSTIHLSKPVWFKDLEAEDLTLWSVSIPIVPANKRRAILLNEFLESAMELDSTDNAAEVFKGEPPTKTIHIIVQRPFQVRAESCNWASTVTKPHNEKRPSLGFRNAVICWTLA